MTPFARGLAPAACAAFLLACTALSCAAPPGWISDYRKALELSRKEGKPIIADFSTDWCPNCRKLESNTFNDPSVSGRLDQFIKVYIDGDRHPEMVEQFGVEGFPTLVAISPQGQELDRSVGYVNPRRLAGTLDRAIQSAPVIQPEERKPETAVANARSGRNGQTNSAGADQDDTKPSARTVDARPAATPKTVAKAATVTKLPEGANFYTMNVSREPPLQVAATAPRREFQVAQAPPAGQPATTTDAGTGELPRPLINVGRTRAATAESAPAAPAESQPKAPARSEAESRPAAPAPAPESAAAPATPSVSSDPLATVRLLQATPGAARAEAPQAPAETVAPPPPTRTADKPAAAAKPSAAESRATPKPATAAAPKAIKTPAPAAERPAARDTAAATPATGRAATPPSREDAERWMKDGDEKLRDGRKKEARAQYAKIVETDPSNQTGYADVGFIKMVSLMVDRDDPALRQEAYSKVSEFLARYPNSPHKDYYTVIRATLAIDLDRTEDAAALLQDFPTQFPNSRFTEMAYKLWTSLPAARRTQAQAPRRQ